MGRGKRLSEVEQGQIRVLHDEGLSIRKIALKIGRSHQVVGNYLRDTDNYGKKCSPGRPRKLDKTTERFVRRIASNSQKTACEIRDECGLSVNPSTILRTLHRSSNIVRQTLKSCPNLSLRHVAARKEIAEEWMDFGRKWDRVVFSDEKKFNLDGPDGAWHYWRDLRKEPKYFKTRNFGGGSLMIWAGFSVFGKTPVAFCSTKMNSLDYQEVLRMNLLPYFARFRSARHIFQQDNAAIHSSRSTNDWLSANNITVLKWPACSPDLNPMENAWALIVRDVYRAGRQYGSVAELRAEISKAWDRLPMQTLIKLSRIVSESLLRIAEAERTTKVVNNTIYCVFFE
uniref:Transposable element Tc3 transposase n=1 Tax=Steinernema glaseri TaxID=37863 RepID=A0A1I7YKG6_9BILA